MSKMLKPLLLPKLVEERRKRESLQETEFDLHSPSSPYYMQNSSASDVSSPSTPTFSMRGHQRFSSSSSSTDTSTFAPVTESPASPTFSQLKSGKRSLPDVQEEPQEKEDRNEDFDMFEDIDESYDCFFDDQHCAYRDPVIVQSAFELPTRSDFDIDINDGFFGDGDAGFSSRFKKRRAGESPFSAMTMRLGTRFPSFSRKWRLRKGDNAKTLELDTQREAATSRAASSSRSSSLSNSVYQSMEASHAPTMPPTPTKSLYDGREDYPSVGPIDIERANRDSSEREEGFASTPLLPPLMMDASANTKQVAVQSPLQSPSVADPADPFSGMSTPIDTVASPQVGGIPSPPLSNKPSISSFHRANLNRPGHLIPSSEIPPILIADENDVWANKLGHANFNVHPEPYVPEFFDVEACRQLRANWDLARCNYTKHLVRTGEHYGVTSKTYALTEEKWAETDAIWKKNNDITIQNTVESDGDAFSTLKHTTFGDSSASNIMTKIPSLNDPQSQGKFPQLGDEDIVGPMVQVAAQLQRSPSKKAKLMRFFTEKFPTGLGMGKSISQ